MEATRSSLLIRARAGDAGAWEDLCELYRPLIVGWLRRQSIPEADLDDLVQEIFLAVVGSDKAGSDKVASEKKELR